MFSLIAGGLVFAALGSSSSSHVRGGLFAMGIGDFGGPFAPFVSLTACSKDETAAPKAEPIVLGATAPLTGAQQSLGPSVQQMLQLAVAQINARGGVLGRELRIDVRDDGSDPAITTGVAQDLLTKANAVALVGPSTSSEALAVLDLFRDAKRPMVSPLALSPELTTREPARERFFFRTESSALFQARAMAKFLRAPSAAATTKDGGAADADTSEDASRDAGTDTQAPRACNKLAIFHFDDLSGVGTPVSTELASKFTSTGGSVVLDVKVDPNAKSYRDAIAQLVASDAECQVLLMLSTQGALFLREFREVTATDATRDWASFVTMGSISFYTAGFIAAGRADPTNSALPTAAEGIYGTALDLAPDKPSYWALNNLYQTQFPSEGGASAPAATSVYDAVLLVALAIEQAQSTDGVMIRDALFDVSKVGKSFGPLDYAEAVAAIRRGEDIDYQGASGDCDFDDRGDVLQDEIVWKVQGGAFQTEMKLSAADLQ